MDEGFQEVIRDVQEVKVGLILEGVDVGEYMSLRISLKRV